MTVQTIPYALQNASHSAALFRQATSAPFQTPGILGVGELALSQQGTPNMSVVLGPGRGKVAGSQVTPPTGLSFTTQAMYDVLNDANVTLTVTTSNPSNPRIDAAYIGVQDSFYSGASNTALAGIVAGTPGASPVAPAIPANSLLLGYIAVGANVTSIVTANITPSTSLAGLLPSALLPPTSVTGGTINPDGSITVTGSRLSLDGLLTKANVVKIDGTVSVASNQVLFARLRAGGSDIASNCAQQLGYAAAGTGTMATAQNPSGTGVWQLGAQSSSWHRFTLLLSNGGQALPTIGNVDLDAYGSLTSMSKVLSSLFQTDATVRDGVGIGAGSITGTAAMSGTVRCYAIG